MKFPNKSYLAQLRKQYPVGTKIQLISMRDEKYFKGALDFIECKHALMPRGKDRN